jgi:hypothetical protein
LCWTVPGADANVIAVRGEQLVRGGLRLVHRRAGVSAVLSGRGYSRRVGHAPALPPACA